jgi:FG-GAP repeat protein
VTTRAGLLILVLAGGCDWRTFDQLSDSAWAKSTGSPGDPAAQEWGVGITWAGGSGDGVTFLGAGQRPDGVGSIVFDAQGNHSGAGAPVSLAGLDNLDPMGARPALAGDPGQGAAVLGLGRGNDTSGQVLVFDVDGPSLLTSYQLGSQGIDAVAVGDTDNSEQPAGTPDLVVVNENQLTLVGNYIATASTDRSQDSCTLARERGYAVAIGDLDAASAGGEIAVGMGNASQDGSAGGQVMVLSGATVEAAALGSFPCVDNLNTLALADIQAPAAEASFGDQVVIADFDGEGTMDLAVSAPLARVVYVWLNVDLANLGAPDATISAPADPAPGRFGIALAAGDFDGDGAAELVVGDDQATVGGKANAGRAWIIEAGTGDFATVHQLGDAQPESEQHFGRALAVGRFGGTTDVLSVAAHAEVFTYFRTPLSDVDVRD